MAVYQFDKARLLSYSHTPVSFENGTRYKIQKKLNIQGSLYVAYNDSGVSETWSKAELLSSAADYGEVVLNGTSFGLGKITNISFDPGNHVERQDYTFDVECYSEIDALAFGPGLTPARAALIDRITESVSYEIDNEDNYVFTQNASVRLNRIANSNTNTELDAAPDPLSLAETVIDSLFANNTLFNSEIGLDPDLFFGSGLKIIKTRSYSLVDSVCTFSRKLTIPPSLDSQKFSIALNYDLKFQNGGIVTVTEKGTITGLDGTQTNDPATNGPYASALIGLNQYFPGGSNDDNSAAQSRCFEVYGPDGYNYSQLPLSSKPIQKNVTLDQFKGTIEYSITFSNDPKYVNRAVWSFTDRIEINDNGDTIISESGSIIGFGRPYGTGEDDRLGNALQCFNANVGNGGINTPVRARTGDLFQSYKQYKENSQFTMTRRSFEESHLDGSVNYSFEYTDVSDYIVGTNTDVRRVEIETTTSMPVAVTQTYNVFNYKQIIQPQNQSSVGSKTVTIKLRGRRNLPLSSYLSFAKNLAATRSPSGIPNVQTSYIKSANYSINPNTNEFSLSVGWNFVGPTYAFGSTNLS